MSKIKELELDSLVRDRQLRSDLSSVFGNLLQLDYQAMDLKDRWLIYPEAVTPIRYQLKSKLRWHDQAPFCDMVMNGLDHAFSAIQIWPEIADAPFSDWSLINKTVDGNFEVIERLIRHRDLNVWVSTDTFQVNDYQDRAFRSILVYSRPREVWDRKILLLYKDICRLDGELWQAVDDKRLMSIGDNEPKNNQPLTLVGAMFYRALAKIASEPLAENIGSVILPANLATSLSYFMATHSVVLNPHDFLSFRDLGSRLG